MYISEVHLVFETMALFFVPKLNHLRAKNLNFSRLYE